jgi:hypothetical protein
MAAITLAAFKARVRGAFGDVEDSTHGLKDKVDRLFQRTHHYRINERLKAATMTGLGVNAATLAQTGSLSMTQPVLEHVIFVAEEACVVQSVSYTLFRVSVTVSTSDNWTLEIRKLPLATATYTISDAVSVATLTSNTDSITINKIHGRNPCTMTSTVADKTLAAGDQLSLRVTKALLGAEFRAGLVKITIDEA